MDGSSWGQRQSGGRCWGKKTRGEAAEPPPACTAASPAMELAWSSPWRENHYFINRLFLSPISVQANRLTRTRRHQGLSPTLHVVRPALLANWMCHEGKGKEHVTEQYRLRWQVVGQVLGITENDLGLPTNTRTEETQRHKHNVWFTLTASP